MTHYSQHGRRSGDIERRAKQIALRNPGHPTGVAMQAAQEEAAAIQALNSADEIGRDAAELHLRVMQLRAVNLDMDHEAARELAQRLFETPKHYLGR